MTILAKKSLGQNFLRDKTILDKIIKSANLTADDFVVEIGPGEGVLTEELAKYAKKVVAIEIDKDLAAKLKNKFKNNKNVEIIEDDILKINLPELIERNSQLVISNSDKNTNKNPNYQLQITNYKLIANIPYYITSPIIRLFLETKYPPTEMILMIQKEVAQRIVAKPGEMSILAISVQYYAKPEILFTVPRTAFYPIPEVDSAIIHITRNTKHETKNTKKFFRIVKAGFAAKRKTLANNLSSSLHLDKSEVEEKLKKSGITPIQRAQELSIEDWKRLIELF